jgi:uncharacterized membrane protein YkvA (DUF1232 family)
MEQQVNELKNDKALIQAKRFRGDYSEDSFWAKLARYAKTAGRQTVESALQLYYASLAPATPAWAKGVIYGALGYFISPIDVIPDLIPGGYADDLGVLAAAVAAVAMHITPEIRVRAAEKIRDWFGA